MDLGIRDTAAFRVIEEILLHTWGVDAELEDDEVFLICKLFGKSGGKWLDVMDGDPKSVHMLEECINNILQAKKLRRVAFRVMETFGNV